MWVSDSGLENSDAKPVFDVHISALYFYAAARMSWCFNEVAQMLYILTAQEEELHLCELLMDL